LPLPPQKKRSAAASFDHFVSAGEERGRYRKPECGCRFQIDDELELGRLEDGQVSRLLTAQNAAGIDTRLPPEVRAAAGEKTTIHLDNS
jgi:hypothetical protein